MDTLHTLMHIVRNDKLSNSVKYQMLLDLYADVKEEEDEITLQYIRESITELSV